MATLAFQGTYSIATPLSFTAVTLTEVYDPSGMHDPGTHPTRLTIPTTGWWMMYGTGYNGDYSGIDSEFRADGTTQIVYDSQPSGFTTGVPGVEALYVAYLIEGQYIEYLVRTGGTGTMVGSVGCVLLPDPKFVSDVATPGGAGYVSLVGAIDEGGWHSDSINPSRITVDETTNYMVVVHAGAQTPFDCQVVKNHTTVIHEGYNQSGATQSTEHMISLHPLTAGDYLEVYTDSPLNTLLVSVVKMSGVRGAMASQTAPQTVGSPSTIAFDAEVVDTTGYHSTTVNNDRVTIPTSNAGAYLVFLDVALPGFVANIIALQYNAVETVTTFRQTEGNHRSHGAVCYVNSLAVGDYFNSFCYSNSSATEIAGTYIGLVCVDDFNYNPTAPGHLLPLLGVGG